MTLRNLPRAELPPCVGLNVITHIVLVISIYGPQLAVVFRRQGKCVAGDKLVLLSQSFQPAVRATRPTTSVPTASSPSGAIAAPPHPPSCHVLVLHHGNSQGTKLEKHIKTCTQEAEAGDSVRGLPTKNELFTRKVPCFKNSANCCVLQVTAAIPYQRCSGCWQHTSLRPSECSHQPPSGDVGQGPPHE